ncbi:MAG: B12-binding domain-containing radical SAM protein [Desulfarculus sp.]|nr:B12-binding domain-containing radical SAM protein [Desulfarculus sp.]
MKVMFLIRRLSLEGEPMGVMQLSALAKAAGHDTAIALLEKDFLAAIKKYAPGLLAVSMMSNDYVLFRRALDKVRAQHPRLPIIVGGPHPTFVPATIENMAADAFCVGEGDQAFLDVLDRLEKQQDLEGIPNIITSNRPAELRPLIQDLDSLPFLDRRIVYENSLPLKRFAMRSFYTTRGCPFQCTYCFNHADKKMYRGKGSLVRRRSVEGVISEMEQVRRDYDCQFVRISDDSFVLRQDQWLEDFARAYRRRVGLPFYCLMRAEVVTEDVVKLLKEAGCVSVCMSIETANQKTRREVLCRNGSNDTLIRAFDLFNQAGINIYTNNMLGLPGSTIEDDIATLRFNLRCRPAYCHFSICVPFPGTNIFKYCVEHGYLDPGISLEQMNESTLQTSMLDCFSEREKAAQLNLAMLGPDAVHFPGLFDLITQKMIYWPHNVLFGLAHYLTKNYLFKKKIVPIKFRAADYLMLGLSQLKTEVAQLMRRK